MVKKIVYIEGHPNIGLDGGSLRESFKHILMQGNYQIPVEIRMGKSREQCSSNYKNLNYPNKYLLLDLDTEDKNRANVIKDLKLEGDNHAHFMVQQCEAWFLSQPEILDNFFGYNFTTEFQNIEAKEISNPAGKIKEKVAKDSNNMMKYRKIEHCSILLKKLNTEKLKTNFEVYKNLTEQLNK